MTNDEAVGGDALSAETTRNVASGNATSGSVLSHSAISNDVAAAPPDNEPYAASSYGLPDDPLLDSTRGKRRRKNVIIAVIACAALALIGYWFFFRSQPAGGTAKTSAAQVVVSVRTAMVEHSPIAMDVQALGTIFPREQATVSATNGGQIRQMRLLKNQVVRQGEVIAQLDTRDLQAQRAEAVAALQSAQVQARSITMGAIPQANAQNQRDLQDARASVANARALYDRRQALYRQGGIALRDVEASQLALITAEDNLRLVERTAALRTSAIIPNDQAAARNAVTQAEQRIKTIDAQMSFAQIRAPLTGIVTDQFQFEGEYAAPGARLVNIADISEVIVKANFADTVVANLKVGEAATVIPSDLAGERMAGRVSLISRSSDPLNRTIEVWVNLGNASGRLRAGGAAEVIVATNNANDALVVPASAVTLNETNADAGSVMVVDKDSVAHETKIKIGIRALDRVQIIEGLNAGDTVITQGNYALPDNTKVEVNNAGSPSANGTSGATGNPSATDNPTTGTSQTPGAGSPNTGSPTSSAGGATR